MQDELRNVFEGTRRGSASMRTAPASSIDSAAHTPVRTDRQLSENQTPFAGLPPSVEMPPASSTDPPTALRAGDLYEDETSTDTDRRSIQTLARAAPGFVDEASADHPIRTVRPAAPSAADADIEIDVDMDHDSQNEDPTTSRGTDLATLHRAATSRPKRRNSEEEDETETMQLTPELRARIEQMTRSAVPSSATKDSNRPPPTRRLMKPNR